MLLNDKSLSGGRGLVAWGLFCGPASTAGTVGDSTCSSSSLDTESLVPGKDELQFISFNVEC